MGSCEMLGKNGRRAIILAVSRLCALVFGKVGIGFQLNFRPTQGFSISSFSDSVWIGFLGVFPTQKLPEKKIYGLFKMVSSLLGSEPVRADGITPA